MTLKDSREVLAFNNLNKNSLKFSPLRVYRRVNTINKIFSKDGYIDNKNKDLLVTTTESLYRYIYFDE